MEGGVQDETCGLGELAGGVCLLSREVVERAAAFKLIRSEREKEYSGEVCVGWITGT